MKRFGFARTLLGGTIGAMVLAAAMAFAPAAYAGTNTTVTGPVNGGYTGIYSHTSVNNSQWMIDNYALQVTGSYGWTNTFTFQVKLAQPLVSGEVALVSGSVTNTTEYGSSTSSFKASGLLWQGLPTAPFGVSSGNNIWADNGNWYGIEAAYGSTPVPVSQVTLSPDPGGWLMFNTEYNMVYFGGGQNAGYWFGL